MANFFEHCLAEVLNAHGPLARNGLALEDLCLDNVVTAVRLNNGWCGIAMNFDRVGLEPGLSAPMAAKLRQRLLERVRSEPLLEGTLYQSYEGPTQRSMTVAILSALAQPLITNQHLTPRGCGLLRGRAPISHWRECGGRIAVIGCGGYAVEAILAKHTSEVVISDLAFGDSLALEAYKPFFENIVEPNKHLKTIRLTDGRDNAEVVRSCDVLFITGSALINGSLFDLLSQAGEKAAIVVEGNSAGLYPFSLFELGVTHVVQTVVDIDYVALSRRFARQSLAGHIELPSAQYTEIVLPEMRTLERLPTFRRGAHSPATRKLLLLQARSLGDPMLEHEVRCFRDKIPWSFDLESYNLVDGLWSEETLKGYSGVLVGGNGDYGSTKHHPWFVDSLSLLSRIVELGLPLLCTCWGHQALAVALGGIVKHDPQGYEFGMLPVSLTPEGESDPLLGELTNPFLAPLGHCDQVVKMPSGAVLLASTERCRVQAYRLKDAPVYALQFHPELSRDQLRERVGVHLSGGGDSRESSAITLIDRFIKLLL